MIPYPTCQAFLRNPFPAGRGVRRALVLVGLACGGQSLLGAALADESRSKLIERENGKPGGADWQLTRVRVDGGGFRSPWIEGYCSKQSVKAGETIEILVSTSPAEPFEIEIFRTGYYGGRGARSMLKLGPFAGKPQPTPEPGEKNIHECQWRPSTRLTIPKDWLSGVYLGRLTTLPEGDARPYWQSYVVFIVRDDRPADVLFQCSDNTWQAYNRWPNDYSVYTHPKGTEGPWADVSFDRPYGREAQFTGVVNDPLTVGSGEFLPLEFPLAYWLEQHGYDVTYCSNSDMLSPERGLKCKSFISVGHDEYWDLRQFRSVETMRDAGVNLLFLSGNAVCWVTPFRAGGDGRANRVIFRGGPYGADNDYALLRLKKDGPFPEHGPDEGLLMGARNIEPVNGGGDWIITKPEHWVFAGTGVKKGDRIPGLIGWEYHGQPADIPGLEVVAAGTAWQGGENPQQWTATIYPGPKGNFVFNASTIFWCQGLSSPPGHTLPWSHWSRPHGPDERVRTITHNLLAAVLAGPVVAAEEVRREQEKRAKRRKPISDIPTTESKPR
ncbi:MAG TPA: N,N-dimethylformamidase beta subunit family domain-containing protein [Pirellulales bacterium]|nr:N,N-dimethylformamidase beta subunit family domain-containing protein [Pirellulales bacterium]